MPANNFQHSLKPRAAKRRGLQKHTVGIQYGFFAHYINTVYYSEEKRRDKQKRLG